MNSKNRNMIGQIGFFARNHRWSVLMVMSMVMVYFFGYFQRVAVPGMVFNELQTDLHMTASAVAMLGAIFLYIYGGMQVFTGLLVDHYGYRRIFLLGGLGLTVGAILFPLSPAPWALYGLRAVVGLGSSLLYISIIKAIDQHFEHKHFALMLGFALFLGYAGGLFATAPFTILVGHYGWRHALLGAGCVGAFFYGMSYLVLRRAAMVVKTAQHGPWTMIASVLGTRSIYPVLIAGTINFSIYFTVQATVGKKVLTDILHISSPRAASLAFVMMICLMIGTLLGGFILRWSRGHYRKILLTGTCMTATALVLILLGLTRTEWGWSCFFLAYALLAFSASLGPIFLTAIKVMCPPSVAGTSAGFINGVCYLGVAIMTNLVGLVLDIYRSKAVVTPDAIIYPTSAYQTFFAIAGVMSLISIALASRIPRHIVTHESTLRQSPQAEVFEDA